jgi:hypothetical protein
MKIRIRKSAFFPENWIVEVQPWWSLSWDYVRDYGGPDGLKTAQTVAAALARPTIIEVHV